MFLQQDTDRRSLTHRRQRDLRLRWCKVSPRASLPRAGTWTRLKQRCKIWEIPHRLPGCAGIFS